MKLLRGIILFGLMACSAQAQPISFIERASFDIAGVENVVYDPDTRAFWCTSPDRLVSVDPIVKTLSVKELPPDLTFTHLDIGPPGEGVFCIAARSRTLCDQGLLIIYHHRFGDILAYPVGAGPEAVQISADGRGVMVLCEGEPCADAAGLARIPVGGVSIFNTDQLARFDRSLAALEPRLSNVRSHPALQAVKYVGMEPESFCVHEELVYVTLQENNAIGVYDPLAAEWTDLIPIPATRQTIDASDQDGIAIDDEVMCLPMPDQIVHADNALFFAGEGDTRNAIGEGGLEDHARLGALVEMGKARAQPGLERLTVCTFTGDTDDDGIIDHPHAFGSRALHRYDLVTGTWSDTGSLIERTIAELYPEHFPEDRSDDRGPEPEGVSVAEIDGRSLIFVSLERPGAVMAFDTALNLLGTVMSASDGHTGPEGMCFVPATASPLGVDTLAVAFEHAGHLVLYELSVGG